MANRETEPEKELRQWKGVQPDEQLEALLERIAELEIAHQLQLLRVMMPGVLEKLSAEERESFMEEIEATGEVQ